MKLIALLLRGSSEGQNEVFCLARLRLFALSPGFFSFIASSIPSLIRFILHFLHLVLTVV